jgi:pilus assembly protein Flp/PilA
MPSHRGGHGSRKNAENTGFRTTVVYQGKGGDFNVSRAWFRTGRSRQSGQGMVEYALILVLVSIVVIVILLTMGNQIQNVFSNVVAALG